MYCHQFVHEENIGLACGGDDEDDAHITGVVSKSDEVQFSFIRSCALLERSLRATSANVAFDTSHSALFLNDHARNQELHSRPLRSHDNQVCTHIGPARLNF